MGRSTEVMENAGDEGLELVSRGSPTEGDLEMLRERLDILAVYCSYSSLVGLGGCYASVSCKAHWVPMYDVFSMTLRRIPAKVGIGAIMCFYSGLFQSKLG